LMPPLIYALISALLGALGQVLWKHGLLHLEFEPAMFFSLDGLRSILLNGWVPAGIVCYFASMILWLKALKAAELSYVYPLLSLNFVILTLTGALLFHEGVTPMRALGVALIVAGVLMVARS